MLRQRAFIWRLFTFVEKFFDFLTLVHWHELSWFIKRFSSTYHSNLRPKWSPGYGSARRFASTPWYVDQMGCFSGSWLWRSRSCLFEHTAHMITQDRQSYRRNRHGTHIAVGSFRKTCPLFLKIGQLLTRITYTMQHPCGLSLFYVRTEISASEGASTSNREYHVRQNQIENKRKTHQQDNTREGEASTSNRETHVRKNLSENKHAIPDASSIVLRVRRLTKIWNHAPSWTRSPWKSVLSFWML